MLAEALAALAGVGGTAVVGAMATDAWQATRSQVARLFRRGGRNRQAVVEAQLDHHAALVERSGDPDQARQSLAGLWSLELQELLAEHPDAAEELQEVIEQVRAQLPARQQAWVQTNIARDQATQNIVQHGTLHVHPCKERPAGLFGADGGSA